MFGRWSLLGQLGDPVFDRARNLTLLLSPGLFILTMRGAMQSGGVVTFDDSYFRVQGIAPAI